MAQVALLQTDMDVVSKFFASNGMNSGTLGLTCSKQALVKSPSNANELCLTSRTGS